MLKRKRLISPPLKGEGKISCMMGRIPLMDEECKTFSRMGDKFLSELKRDRYPPVTGRKDHSQILRGHHMQRLVEIYLSHEGREIYSVSISQKECIPHRRDLYLARREIHP
jgi:hypothetical protein